MNNSNHPIYTVNSSPYAVPVYHKLGFIDMDSEQLADGMRFTPMKFERYRDNGIQNGCQRSLQSYIIEKE